MLDLPEGGTYVCDLCARPADPEVEECWNVDCRAHCGGEHGDVYHGSCIQPWLKSKGKGISVTAATHGAHWPCPKGKGKGDSAPCKSWVDSASIIIPKNKKEKKKKAQPPPLPPGKKPQDAAAAAAAMAAKAAGLGPRKAPKTTSGWGSAITKNWQAAPQVTRGPPIEEAPKADPLGRKLPGATSQAGEEQEDRALPPGYDPEAALKANRNARKRAKAAAAKAAAAAAAGAASEAGSAASGSRLTQQQLGPSSSAGEGGASGGASTCSGPSGFGEGGGLRLTIDEQHRALMGGGNFITDPKTLAALLGGMGMLSDEEEDWQDDDDSSGSDEEDAAAAAAAAGGGRGDDVVQQQDQAARSQLGGLADAPQAAAPPGHAPRAHAAAGGDGAGGAATGGMWGSDVSHSSAASTPEGWRPPSAAGMDRGEGRVHTPAAGSAPTRGPPLLMTEEQTSRVVDQLLSLGPDATDYAMGLMGDDSRLNALRHLQYDHVQGLLQQRQLKALQQAVQHMQQQLALGAGVARVGTAALQPAHHNSNGMPPGVAAAGGGGGGAGGWGQEQSWQGMHSQQLAAPRPSLTVEAEAPGQQGRPPPPGFSPQQGSVQQQQQQPPYQQQQQQQPPHLQSAGLFAPQAAMAAAPPALAPPVAQHVQPGWHPALGAQQVAAPAAMPGAGAAPPPWGGPYQQPAQQQQQQQQQQQGYMAHQPQQPPQQQPSIYLNGMGPAGGAPGVAPSAAPYGVPPLQAPTYAPAIAAPMAAAGHIPALPFLQPQQPQQQQQYPAAAGGHGFLQPASSATGVPTYAPAVAAYGQGAGTAVSPAALLPAVPTAGAHKHLYAHHSPGLGGAPGGGQAHAVHQGPDGEEDEDQEALLEELVLMLT